MRYILLVLLLGLTHMGIAQKVDSIHVGDAFQYFEALNYGTYEFEVYTERDEKKSSPMVFKSNTSTITVDGNDYVKISHNWTKGQTSGGFNALVEPGTFKPIIQIRTSEKGKEAYRFYEDKLVGLDSAVDNTAQNYELALEEPVFNFEIDLETYSILPLEEGKEIYLPFYHAGSAYSKPDWYHYQITSDVVEVDDLGMVDAWMIYTDYHGKQPTKFWYTKEDRKFVKMEASFRGMKIYKVRKF